MSLRSSLKHEIFSLLGVCALLVSSPVVTASTPGNEGYESGRELYDLGCASCHGKNMQTTGTFSFNLKKFPKDQKQRFIESVTNGKDFMPALGAVFDAEEIEQLWIYVSQPAQ